MPDSDNAPVLETLPAEESPQPLGEPPAPPVTVDPVPDAIIDDADKLFMARDLLRAKEADRYRLSLVPEDANPDTIAIIETQIARLQDTVSTLTDALGPVEQPSVNVIVAPEPPRTATEELSENPA